VFVNYVIAKIFESAKKSAEKAVAPHYLAELFSSALKPDSEPEVFFCYILWRQTQSGHTRAKREKRLRHIMWQDHGRPCAVFTKISELFAPYYLAGIRHDLRQTTLHVRPSLPKKPMSFGSAGRGYVS
jgi:hypothetical protein